MIVNIVALVIGALILTAGLYYLVREKNDRASRKIYGAISGIGAAVIAIFVIKLLIELAGA